MKDIKGMKKEEVYVCEYCNTHEVFLGEKSAEEHVEKCIMNPQNKTYATSKHLGIELYPPFPRFEREGRALEVEQFIGKHHRGYDVRTGEYIKEEDWFSEVKDWEEADRDITTGKYVSPIKTKTKEYEKFINTFSKPKSQR